MTALKATYAKSEIHDHWESVFRGNPLLDQFNDRLMDRLLASVNLPPNALFLDAGCGVGDHAIRIAERGYQCVGADISETILQRAVRNVESRGLGSRVRLVCGPLEDLSFADATFDVIHCRGVLMHVPQWERALSNLCRVLKPGGKILILEMNHRSVEAMMVRLARKLMIRKSQLVKTPAGLEFWSEEDGNPFVVRLADVAYLAHILSDCRVRVIKRWASEFWDINRFPTALRSTAIRFNQLWFTLRLPAFLSSGNIIIGKKTRDS